MSIDIDAVIETALTNWGVGARRSVLSNVRTRIERWFENFPESEHDLVANLVNEVKVVTGSEIESLTSEIANDIAEYLGPTIHKSCVLPIGGSLGASGAQYVYKLKQKLAQINPGLVFDGTLEEAAEIYEAVILVDDIVGSGGQAIDNYNKVLKLLPTRAIYAPVCAFESGLVKVDKKANYEKVIAGKILREHDKAFSDDSIIFPDPVLRDELKHLCKGYGEKLYPEGPLGYENTQAMLSFSYNCPNNTLPVIWAGPETDEKSSTKWHPLQVRKKKLAEKHSKRASKESKPTRTKAIKVMPENARFSALNGIEKKWFSALSILGIDFPLTIDLIEFVSNSLGQASNLTMLLDLMEGNRMLQKVNKVEWETSYVPNRAKFLLSKEERKTIADGLVSLFTPDLNINDQPFFVKTENEAKTAMKVYSTFSNLDYFDRRKFAIINAVKTYYATQDSYLEYIKILELEGQSFRNKYQQWYWNRFTLARARYFIGDLTECFRIIEEIYYKLSAEAQADITDPAYFVGVKTSCLRLVSQILIDLGHSSLAVKILDKVVAETDVAILNHTIASQNMLMFTLALISDEFPNEGFTICEEIIEGRYQGFISEITLMISKIHKALALINSNKIVEGISLLTGPAKYFEVNDKRAYIWVLSIRCEANLRISKHKLAAQDIKRILNETNKLKITTPLVLHLVEKMKEDEKFSVLKKQLASYFNEHSRIEKTYHLFSENVENERLIERILLEFDIDSNKEYFCDVKKYKLLTPQNHPALNSEFMRSFIRKEKFASDELESKLDALFVEHVGSEGVIFSTPVFNNLIVELCKKDRLLNKKYIYPYLENIKNQYGGILLFYARYFELVDDLENAETLLSMITNKRSFAYLNVEANVAGKRNFDAGIELNDLILERIPGYFHQQRARIYNNMAFLIHRENKVLSYPDAITYCALSIENNRNPKFHYPKNLLLTLRLEMCSLDMINNIIDAHKSQFNTPKFLLVKAVKKVRNSQNRKHALKILG